MAGHWHLGRMGFYISPLETVEMRDDVGNGHVPDWYTVNAGGNGQDNYANLMGDILRIDVNGSPYNIPPDNPLVGTAAKPGDICFWFQKPVPLFI